MALLHPCTPVEQVQTFLDSIGADLFSVTFVKSDGSLREMTGRLDPNGKRSNTVPVQTTLDNGDSAWRSFKLDSVVYIGRVEP